MSLYSSNTYGCIACVCVRSRNSYYFDWKATRILIALKKATQITQQIKNQYGKSLRGKMKLQQINKVADALAKQKNAVLKV